MIVVSAKNIGKAYGTDVILEGISFHINKGDRVGIIGVNGAGKTTLLKILTGEMENDEGEFFISEDTTVGYLKQHDSFSSENTVIEEATNIFSGVRRMEADMAELSDRIAETADDEDTSEQLLKRFDAIQQEYDRRGGYSYRSEITGILKSMAFDESFFSKKVSTLSGGERTRLALACLLLKKPDILLLDEPTNHLDIGTLRWLEQYLRSYQGTIVIVSHDRYFLDQIATKIFEIENHRLKIYSGGYTAYARQKKAEREDALRKYKKQQTEIRRQEDMIRRYKERGTEKLAKRAASREKRLDAVERIERPDGEGRKMKISFRENFKSGNDVLFGEGLSKGFGYGSERKELFQDVDFDIKRGERICIVGPNGVGKTTLLRILIQELKPDKGRLKIGHNVDFGYYDQEQAHLTGSNTVLEELKDSYRLYTDTDMRSILGRFLFTEDDVFVPVDGLSGGEKARLSLVKLMLSGANVLVLDEPTNHLDISSKEVFEDALLDFPGTVITVSHDRYFLNRIPTRILELEEDGFTEYLGKYDYYTEKKEEISSGKEYLKTLKDGSPDDDKPEKEKISSSGLSAQEERKLRKEREAKERRLKRAKEKLENEIAELEAECEEIEAEMSKPEVITDHEKLSKLSRMLSECKDELDAKYEEWVEL